MGAWIEIASAWGWLKCLTKSHPSWVRGLKWRKEMTYRFVIHVAPFMGAWIEMASRSWKRSYRAVAPFMGAWIEIKIKHKYTYIYDWVAPFMGAWIEIKMCLRLPLMISCRTLHGCVDWNRRKRLPEILSDMSHPSWVRGLKSELEGTPKQVSWGRTLHGCVDWNFVSRGRHRLSADVAPFMGAWIEIVRKWGLHHESQSRTLHGCVDWNEF